MEKMAFARKEKKLEILGFFERSPSVPQARQGGVVERKYASTNNHLTTILG